MFEIKLKQFIWAISAAADLVGVTDTLHGRRVAFYAQQIAKQLTPDFPWKESDIILVGLLHDCGVSSTDVHEHLVKEMEWARVYEHCDRGADLLAGSLLLRDYASSVRLHHTRWALFDRRANAADDVLLANLIFLADRLDVLCATQMNTIIGARKKILATLQGYAGSLFNPDFIAALLQAAENEDFWHLQSEDQLKEHFTSWQNQDSDQQIDAQELRTLFGIFGLIVDSKSRFTGSHSQSVADLCLEIGQWLGLGEHTCYRLSLAGLVHDIGTLRIPDAILNQPKDLDDAEFALVRTHALDGLEILSQLDGFGDIARFSAQHHERMDGSGYPNQLVGPDLAIEARVLAIADMLQALAQHRPHRTALHDNQIRYILELEASRGKLDSHIIKVVMEHFQDLLLIARHNHRLVG